MFRRIKYENMNTSMKLLIICLIIFFLCFFTYSSAYLNRFGPNTTVLPHIHPFSFEGEANSGDSVQLTCHVSRGDLPLTIKWLHDSKQMYSHLGVISNKIGDRISLLTIPHVRDQNSGDYMCITENAAGKSNYSTTLFVNGAYIDKQNSLITICIYYRHSNLILIYH